MLLRCWVEIFSVVGFRLFRSGWIIWVIVMVFLRLIFVCFDRV